MAGTFARGVLSLFGWKVTGRIPDDLKKFVVIAVPHTSGWDFPLGVLARSAIGRDIKYIGKKSLFKPPFGWLMKALGGYPVDRSRPTNFVETVVDIFNSKEEFSIALAPEGTRAKVSKFKSGFYHIAKGANAPVIPVKFDYGNKEINYGEPYYLTDNKEADMTHLWNYFKGVKGRNPENSIQ